MSVFLNQIFKIFLVVGTESFFDWTRITYESSDWIQNSIQIHNEFFQVLDPDPYQNDTDPPHWPKAIFSRLIWIRI